MLTVKTDETGKVVGIEGASQELYDLVDAARNGALKLRNESKHPMTYKRHDRISRHFIFSPIKLSMRWFGLQKVKKWYI